MKDIYLLPALLFTLLLLGSCSSDDDTPELVNEEELITTLTVTLVPEGGGTSITLTTQDLDGDGPNEPIISVSSNLSAGVTYNGNISLLNETDSPAENITEEVEEAKQEGLDKAAIHDQITNLMTDRVSDETGWCHNGFTFRAVKDIL